MLLGTRTQADGGAQQPQSGTAATSSPAAPPVSGGQSPPTAVSKPKPGGMFAKMKQEVKVDAIAAGHAPSPAESHAPGPGHKVQHGHHDGSKNTRAGTHNHDAVPFPVHHHHDHPSAHTLEEGGEAATSATVPSTVEPVAEAMPRTAAPESKTSGGGMFSKLAAVAKQATAGGGAGGAADANSDGSSAVETSDPAVVRPSGGSGMFSALRRKMTAARETTDDGADVTATDTSTSDTTPAGTAADGSAASGTARDDAISPDAVARQAETLKTYADELQAAEARERALAKQLQKLQKK